MNQADTNRFDRRGCITQPLALSVRPSLETFLTVNERRGAKRGKRDKRREGSETHHTDRYTLADGQSVSVEYTDSRPINGNQAWMRCYRNATLRGYSPHPQA